jgi:DNA-binding SARP family transcriptional activator
LRQQGASATVAAWIDRLPSKERSEDVLVILAHCQEDSGDLDGALLTLTALEATATDPETQREYAIWLANIHQARGDIVTANRLVEPYLADASIPPRWRAYICRIHAISQALAGNVDDAQHYIQQSIRAATTLHDQPLLARLYQDQATIAGRIGQLGEAEHALRLAERCWRTLDNPPALAGTLNARAMLKLALCDYAGAAALAQQSRALALAGGRHHTAAIASATCGDVAFAQGQYVEALGHYQVAAEDAEHSGDFATWAYSLAWQAHSARLHGDVERAAELLPRLLAHPAESGEDAAWLTTGVVAAQLTLGDAPAIDDLQNALHTVGLEIEDVRVTLLIMLTQAYWQTDQHTEALATWKILEDLVRQARVGSFQRLLPLAMAIPAVLHALMKAEPTPFVQAAHALLSAQPRSAMVLAQRPPQRMLQIRVLGEEVVWWQGQPVTLPSQGVRLLLFLLTMSGPVAEEDVLRAIWEEDAVAVHALRKLVVRLSALMPRVIRRLTGHYTIALPRDEIDLDLWHVFELDLHTASTDQLVTFANAADSGYLATIDAPWAVELRRRMRRRVALMWLEIGRRAEAGEPQAQAYDAFERAQQADPTSDLVARAVLQQARRAGDRSLLIYRYLRYQHALDEELGVEPATDLHNLYLQALEP